MSDDRFDPSPDLTHVLDQTSAGLIQLADILGRYRRALTDRYGFTRAEALILVRSYQESILRLAHGQKPGGPNQ